MEDSSVPRLLIDKLCLVLFLVLEPEPPELLFFLFITHLSTHCIEGRHKLECVRKSEVFLKKKILFQIVMQKQRRKLFWESVSVGLGQNLFPNMAVYGVWLSSEIDHEGYEKEITVKFCPLVLIHLGHLFLFFVIFHFQPFDF